MQKAPVTMRTELWLITAASVARITGAGKCAKAFVCCGTREEGGPEHQDQAFHLQCAYLVLAPAVTMQPLRYFMQVTADNFTAAKFTAYNVPAATITTPWTLTIGTRFQAKQLPQP
jgi:hypothetical protein